MINLTKDGHFRTSSLNTGLTIAIRYSMKNIHNFLLINILLFSLSAKADIVKLLEIPFGDKSSHSYSVDMKETCSFKGVEQIIVPSFEDAQKSNIFLSKVNFYQRKLNLEIDMLELDDDKITFSLTGSKNLYFEFSFSKSKNSKCEMVKAIHFNNKTYSLDHIEIEYSYALVSPVVQRIIIKNSGNKDADEYLYPWQLKGQLSAYELNLGAAAFIHSNIRYRNLNDFQKNNPAIEPIPAFFFRYGPLFLNKNGIGSLLYNKGDFSLLGMGILEGEPYKAKGLMEREQGIFAGAILKYNLVELTWYNDFIHEKGYNLKLNLAPEFYYRLAWKFSPQAFIQYWDKNYVDYYFGVKPSEAASGMRPFNGNATLNYGAGIEVMHFVKKWTYVLNVGVKVYGNEVNSSPTVIDSKEFRFIASVLYKVF